MSRVKVQAALRWRGRPSIPTRENRRTPSSLAVSNGWRRRVNEGRGKGGSRVRNPVDIDFIPPRVVSAGDSEGTAGRGGSCTGPKQRSAKIREPRQTTQSPDGSGPRNSSIKERRSAVKPSKPRAFFPFVGLPFKPNFVCVDSLSRSMDPAVRELTGSILGPNGTRFPPSRRPLRKIGWPSSLAETLGS